MKKKYLFSFLIMLAIALAMAFVGVKNINKTSVASAAKNDTITEPEVVTTIYDYISITQEGHVFTADDLEEEIIAGVPYFNLYTTKTVSISHKEVLPTGDNFVIEEDIDGSYTTISPSDNRVRVYDNLRYYIFDSTALSEDTITKLTIRYTKANAVSPTNPTGQSTIYTLKLNLIQTVNDFFAVDSFTWSYDEGRKEMSAPSNGYEYAPLSLSMPNGSALNPITVRFEYCGEVYEIYNINGIFYNVIGKDLGNNLLDFSTLEFTVSGIYQVEIYDKTHTASYAGANYLKYEFTIENTDASNKYAPFYIHAHNEDGEQIMNQQISNSKTIVEFENITLSRIKNNIDYISVRKSYRPTGGENVTETTRYGGEHIPTSLTFDSDGTYNIDVYVIDQNKPIKSFEFILLDSIRSLFEVDNTKYEISTDEEANVTKTINIERTVSSSYNDGMINGESTYTFELIIARSAPSINGVNNNARTSNTVNLTVNGVGNIDVTITQDGKTYTKTAKNGDSIATFSDPGKYFIKITDEMGTTITKSFTITIKMNTAAIALIIIAIVIVVFMIIFIIASRTKVKVR